MNVYVKNLIRSVLIGIGVFVVLLLINLAAGAKVWNVDYIVPQLSYCIAYTVVIYMANMVVFRMLDKRFEDDRFSPRRLFIGFLASFVVSVLCIAFLRVVEEVVVDGVQIQAYLREEKAVNFLPAIIITLFITLGIHAVHFYRQLQESKMREQRVIAGTASARFETLKNQIDPHFLFNSLNVLSSLIEENPENAQRFTGSLSKIYRYVLEQKDKELIEVEEELNFAQSYLALLKMRFENSLDVNVNVASLTAGQKVVPLSLQLLLENTVKHNVASQSRPLRIEIYTEEDYLVIENTKQIREVLGAGGGVGLQNIINRYALVTDRPVLIAEDQISFKVKIPILTQKVTGMETENQSENVQYLKAQKRVEELKDFYTNLGSYCIVIPFLIAVNLLTNSNYLWFFWPAAGWGMGVIFHALSVFNYRPFLGRDWEQRKIRELMDRDRNIKWK